MLKGYKHTDEARARMSASRRGMTFTAEHKANLAASVRRAKAAVALPPAEKYRKTWQRNIWKKYRATPHDIAILYDTHAGHCPLCDRLLRNDWHIDHDHSTGRLRGLVHRACNTALGHIEGRLDLTNLTRYLEGTN